MERIQVKAIPGLSYLRLGWIVAHLPFEKENARGEMRKQGYKKAVLRALCDRYPNIWPSVDDLAEKASCCVRHVQDILKELERRDRLINNTTPIPPGIPVLSFEGPSIEDDKLRPIIRTVKKVGGAGNPTPYAICDRKIVDWFIQRALAGEIAPGVEPSEEDQKAAHKLMADLDNAQEPYFPPKAPRDIPVPTTAHEAALADLFAAENVADYNTAARRLTEMRKSEVSERAA